MAQFIYRLKILAQILAWTVGFGLLAGITIATISEAEPFPDAGYAQGDYLLYESSATDHGTPRLLGLPASLNEAPASIIPESMMGASIGTAWPIESGFVITNNHVVMDSSDVMLVDQSGQGFRAWAVLRDEVYDIAFLQVEDTHNLPPALPLAGETAPPGTKVFTIGFPRIDVMGTSPKVTEGEICRLEGLNADAASYQTTVPIQPGNSGGPLINMRGEVVGVVKSMIGYRDEAQGTLYILDNASCALKIGEMKSLLRHLPEGGQRLETLPSRHARVADLFDRIEHSLLIVVAR